MPQFEMFYLDFLLPTALGKFWALLAALFVQVGIMSREGSLERSRRPSAMTLVRPEI